MNDKLAIIIPYAQEGSNTFFTCRAIHEDLLEIPHEVLAVDNMCEELANQLTKKNQLQDRGHDHYGKNGELIESHIKVVSNQNKWLKYLQYNKTLSHWQCKSYAVEQTDADYLMFIDAHCIPSQGALRGIFEFYHKFSQTTQSTFHLPLTYNLLDDKRLIYSLKADLKNGFIGYQFAGAVKTDNIYEVPCMSTCGCILSRNVYQKMFGSWRHLKSYGGGENILNFLLATLDVHHYIYNKGTLFHHGNDRGYHWTWEGFHYNRTAAMYLIGGNDMMEKYLSTLKGDSKIIENLKTSVLSDYKMIRDRVTPLQIVSIESFVEKWSI